MKSSLETLFAWSLKAHGIKHYVMEYPFAPPRRWRFDFAFLEERIAVEIHGGVWSLGRHNRPKGYMADLEKMNTAQMMGWMVLQFTGDDIKNGKAIAMINNAFKVRRESH